MKIYIRSAASISPQKTFGNNGFLTEVVEYHENRLRAIAPDYKEYVDAKLLRRMSHVIKMGIAAAKECLNSGNAEMPGAIITGTAYGCVDDTVTFLSNLVENKEELLTPTSFIQSTHNTVAAQIALMLKCHEYNNTFVHKGISFESALLDAIMLLKEKEADNILVGGADEMTDVSFKVLTRLGLYKTWPVSNLSLLKSNSKGTVGGEGASFFLLTGKSSTENMAEINAVKVLYKPVSPAAIENGICSFLAENALEIGDIDLVIAGKSGDLRHDEIYAQLSSSLFKNSALANYKHLCGEYPTSISFALWLASNIIKKAAIPEIVIERKIKDSAPKKILIYNHYQNKYHSLMLVSAC